MSSGAAPVRPVHPVDLDHGAGGRKKFPNDHKIGLITFKTNSKTFGTLTRSKQVCHNHDRSNQMIIYVIIIDLIRLLEIWSDYIRSDYNRMNHFKTDLLESAWIWCDPSAVSSSDADKWIQSWSHVIWSDLLWWCWTDWQTSLGLNQVPVRTSSSGSSGDLVFVVSSALY